MTSEKLLKYAVAMAIAAFFCADQAIADDCPTPQPTVLKLSATGTGTNASFAKAFSEANTALSSDLLAQKNTLQKANACPAKCSWGDFYTDPTEPLRDYTFAASGRVKETAFHEGYKITGTIKTDYDRTCYVSEDDRKKGAAARAEDQKKKEDDLAAAAKAAAAH
jgi:hypothetical protein